MSLRFAILSLLSRESMTGYDLTKRFDSSITFFWSAKHSQIYPELAALTKEGLVTFEVVAQTSKPNKKVYTITDLGRGRLAEWVAEPPDKRNVKDPLILKAWSIGCVAPGAVLPAMREALAGLEKRLEVYDANQALLDEFGAQAPGSPWLGAAMALKLGRSQSEAYRDWLLWAIETLVAVKSAGAAPRP